MLKQKTLVAARSKVWAGGLALVRVDRSPGRVMVMCRELWKRLQEAAFLQNSRYRYSNLPPASNEVEYAHRVRESFLAAVAGAGG